MRALRRSGSGLMGLGAVDSDDQKRISVGDRAKSDPILSTASVLASEILVRLSLVPKERRVEEMRKILNAGEPGMGDRAVREYERLWVRRGEAHKDQTMFDVVRSEIANALVAKTFEMAKSRPMSGLGQTVAEVAGRTSAGVNDANALFCSYGAGTVGMIGGFVDAFRSSGSGATGTITGGAAAGGRIAGCNAGQLALQNQHAENMASIAQQGTAAQLQAQAAAEAAREARFMRLMLLGGGGVIALVAIGLVLKK